MPSDEEMIENVLKQMDYSKLEWRYQHKPRQVARFQLKSLPDLNSMLHGIPYGLIVFTGEAGSGKSTMAKCIASKFKSLYVICESDIDIPAGSGVVTGDYTAYLPNWHRAIAELIIAYQHFKPELIVIDSVTSFLSSTQKAVEEADVRSGLFQIAKRFEDKCPVIAISQVRGSGFNVYPAGGQAVSHSASMLIWFYQNYIGSDTSTRKYSKPLGNVVWTIRVEKDKHGLANNIKEYVVSYVGSDMVLEPVG